MCGGVIEERRPNNHRRESRRSCGNCCIHLDTATLQNVLGFCGLLARLGEARESTRVKKSESQSQSQSMPLLVRSGLGCVRSCRSSRVSKSEQRDCPSRVWPGCPSSPRSPGSPRSPCGAAGGIGCCFCVSNLLPWTVVLLTVPLPLCPAALLQTPL